MKERAAKTEGGRASMERRWLWPDAGCRIVCLIGYADDVSKPQKEKAQLICKSRIKYQIKK